MLHEPLDAQLELPFLNIFPCDLNSSDLNPCDRSSIPWPPPYRLRLSKRSRRVTLSISHRAGLEIVVPERLRRKPNINRLLDEKRGWIEKNLPKFMMAKQKKEVEIKELPMTLNLPAIDRTIHLNYQKIPQKNIKISPLPSILPTTFSYTLSGPVDNFNLVFKALSHFLKSLARDYLTPWITMLAQETNLHFSSISIRSQSTLWGSCTPARKINLNNKLLFLPPSLVRYILIHELCHIKHLNHSQRYWNLVKLFDPDYLEHRRQMRNAGQCVPAWLEH